MTQRTWSVEPFDSLSITRIQPPLRWFDLKVDWYLNFQLNFDVLYNMLDNLTSKINKQTNKIYTYANAGVNQVSQWANDLSQDLQDKANQWNINIQWYHEPEMIEPNQLRNELQTEIAALKNSEYGDLYTNEVSEIETLLTKDTKVSPNIASVQQATTALEGMLRETANTFEKHKKAVSSYDTFLDQINDAMLISENSNIQWDIKATLFNADSKIVETIKTAEHPTISYLNLQENLVDWFSNALAKNSPERLQMSAFDHTKLTKYFSETKETINTIKWYLQTPAENIEKDSLWYQALSVVQSTIAPSVSASNSSSQTVAMSPSNTDNIRWDNNAIYTNQTTYIKKENDNTRYTRYYDFEPIEKYSDFADSVDEFGYISRYNSAFHIWNWHSPITSLEVWWQSNTTTNLRRQNQGHRAYLIMLSDTLFANHEWDFTRDAQRKYVIAYTPGIDIENAFVSLPNMSKKRVKDLLNTTIINTIEIDPDAEGIDIMLSLGWNKRSYASINSLIVSTRGNVSEMEIWAARSVQETLGVQLRWDNSAPVATAYIVEKGTEKIVAQWTNLQVPRKWTYSLLVQWSDDGTVIENTLKWKSGSEKTAKGDAWVLESIDTSENMYILASATDQSNNIGSQAITITFTDPQIEINNVAQQWEQREIGTTLSQTYGDWFVRFFNQRTWDPYVLTWSVDNKSITDFNTSSDSASLTWRVFYDASTISLYDGNQNRIARIDKKTGNIGIEPNQKDKVDILLDFTQNTPSILIIEKATSKTLFSLYLRSSELLDIKNYNGFWLIQLDSTAWTFAWWSCIANDKQQCMVYITTEGNIYTPDTFKSRISWSYSFDSRLQYNITIDNTPAAVITFNPMPLE